MKVEQADPRTLRPHPRNYQRHPPEQLAHLRARIREYGVYRPVLLALGDVVCAGHGLLEAAKLEGLATVPVVRFPVEPSSPAALRLLAGDNETGRGSDRDERALSEVLLELLETDVGLAGAGVDEEELERLIAASRTREERAAELAAEWQGMPEFEQGEQKAHRSVTFHFVDQAAVEEFERRLGSKLPESARWAWFPETPVERFADKRYSAES